MTDTAQLELLASIVRREGRSLMQYLRDVPPWAGLRDANAQAQLREIATTELEANEKLGRWLQTHAPRPVFLGSYPDFTGSNDQAIHFLLPKVIREQTQLLADLERDRANLNGPAGELVDTLLHLKRRHGPELAALVTGPHSMTVVE